MVSARWRIYLRRAVFIFLVLFVLSVAGGFTLLPRMMMSAVNRVASHGPYAVEEEAKSLHQRLRVADMHCDALLWCRDILKRDSRGMVDVPRLIEGNVSLQIFSAVTRMPLDSNFHGTHNFGDVLMPLVFFQGWPASTWFSPRERVLYIAGRFDKAVHGSNGLFTGIRSKEDLVAYLERKEKNPRITAGLLSIEGLQCLEGDLENIRVFYNAGYRMMGPTHFFDTEVGGSAQGYRKGGLTDFGRQVIRKMEEMKIIVDLAHASPKLVDDVLDMATRPVVVSHGGVRANCDNTRNLTDAQILRVAKNGGLVGIGFWNKATCGKDIRSIVRAIQHVVKIAGVDHVALGSDFDGAVSTPFDVSGMPLLTVGLMHAGLSEADIAKIMGDNVLHLLAESLPSEKDTPGTAHP